MGMLYMDYSDSVYRPAEDSYMVMDHANPGARMLEIGAGSGIISIYFASLGKIVTATDISEDAIKLIKHNAEKNNVRINVIESDLFENVNGKYNTIIFNPPYLPVEGESPQWSGGSDGFKVISRFLNDAWKYLEKHGNIYIVLSDLTDINLLIKNYNNRYNFKKIASMDFDFESIFLYELTVIS